MLCFSIVLWLRRLGKSAPKNGRVRRIGCPRCRRTLHHTVARQRFALKRHHAACSEHFWKLSSAKFAPRCGARAIWKSRMLRHSMPGALFEAQLRKTCTALWPESNLEAKTVKTPGARDAFGGSNCILRGRRKDLGTLQNMW